MNATMLQCPNCHAPLPRPAGGFAICQYCGGSVSVGAPVEIGAVPTSAERAAMPAAERTFEERNKTASATFQRSIASNQTPEQAVWYAAHDYGLKGVDPGEAAWAAIALAKDFDAKNKTSILKDDKCILRLLEGYAKLAAEIRSTGTGKLNLPFLTVSANGPLHYDAEFDAKRITALIAKYRS